MVGLVEEAGFEVGYVAVAEEVAIDFDGFDDAFFDVHLDGDFAEGEAVFFG